jgi:hypothetical protein
VIIEWFIGLGGTAADWVLGLFGTDAPPEWLATVATFVNSQLAAAAGLGAWIPWDFAILVAGAVLTLWGTGLAIKFFRWVLGLIPTMGGG